MDSGISRDGFTGMSYESTDTWHNGAAGAASGTVRIWTAIAGVYMMAISTGGLSFVGWRSLDVLEQRLADDRRADQRFNEGLVRAIERLSESAGMLTSADLCPVKFRLRSFGGDVSIPPMRPVWAELCVQSPDGTFRAVSDVFSKQSGLIEFGLHEPGQYRVRMRTPDGLTLEHRFEVLPGVPVDCLVRCPAGSPQGTEYAISIDWPEQLMPHRIAAVCRLVPAEFEQDGWTWSPKRDAGQAVAWNQNCELQAADAAIAEEIVTGPAPVMGDSTGRFTVHSRYWELGEIIFVHLPDSGGTGGPRVLGRLQFGAGTRGTEPFGWSLVDAAPVWKCDQPAPQWEAGEASLWTVNLPTDALQRLSLALTSGAGGTPTSFDRTLERRRFADPEQPDSRWALTGETARPAWDAVDRSPYSEPASTSHTLPATFQRTR